MQRMRMIKGVVWLMVLIAVIISLSACSKKKKVQPKKAAVEAQSDSQSGRELPPADSPVLQAIAQGVISAPPAGWGEPAAVIPAGNEVIIANKGKEYSPFIAVAYITPNHRNDGGLINLWLFDFDPSDYPIGVIAYAPERWISRQGTLLSFPYKGENCLAAPVPFGNRIAYKIRDSVFFTVYPGDPPMEMIEDWYYCAGGSKFIVARARAEKNIFPQYENTAFNEFIIKLKILRPL